MTETSTNVRLKLADVSYSIGGNSILNRIGFEAHGGEFIALMGSNGAGKSTLLDVIAGLRNPSAGAVKMDGRVLAEWRPHELARRVSHLPQAVRVDLPFQAGQLVAMGRYPHTAAWQESSLDFEEVQLAMQRTNCLQFRKRRLTTLSGGERQRVLLAACLAQKAELLLLDEPSTFLDVDHQLHSFALLQQESARNALCICVTHDVNLALAHCTRILVLAEGKLAADVSVQDASVELDWLKFFSPRLQIGTTPNGRPWVWF